MKIMSTGENGDMFNLSSLPEGERLPGQSDDGVLQVCTSAELPDTTNKISSSVVGRKPREASAKYVDEPEPKFVHEPEEQFALLDPKVCLKIFFPGLMSEMATKAVAAEAKKERTKAVTTQSASPTPEETDPGQRPVQMLKNGEQINENETVHTSKAGKTNDEPEQNVCSSWDNSVEYWSDEEYRYPPQRSLSPPPGHYRRDTFTEKKCEEKENDNGNEKQLNFETEESKEIAHHDDCPKSHLKKGLTKKTLSPLIIRKDHNNHQCIPELTENVSPTTPPLLTSLLADMPTGSVCHTSPTSSYGYNWKQRNPGNEQTISSPSLVRPTLATPTIRKEKYLSCSESVFFTPSLKMNNDKLSFGSKRYMLPKRQVSRSQSNTTDLTSTRFPEIPAISKTQKSSKSISDFRQSSSIFGKLVKRNSFKGALDDREKAKSENQGKTIPPASNTVTRNRKVGESTRRKIRRILSLH